MMPDDHDVENVKSAADVAEIVARCSNIYTRFNLSPPMGLQDAARYGTGLTMEEVAAVLRQHLQEYRRFYLCGSGDAQFAMVQSAMRKALAARYPTARFHDEHERPRRPRRRVVKIHHAGGGPPDLLLDDPRAVRLLRKRDPASVERPSTMRGYEGAGVPIGEDDEADA